MESFYTLLSRAEATGDRRIGGYAAVYGQSTARKGTGMTWSGSETIARGAFANVLDGDVLATFNHDRNQVLGRTASGTLRLSSDERGLAFDLDLPDTQLGRDTYELVRRGDLSGMSFSASGPIVERVRGGVVLRGFSGLRDVSVVTVPTYEGATTAVRHAAEQDVREQLLRARARVLGRD